MECSGMDTRRTRKRRDVTLCWDCKNASNPFVCSWARDLTPVKGWNAYKVTYVTEGKYSDFTYCVTECPYFVKDEKRENKVAMEKEPWEKALCKRLLDLYYGKNISFERIGEIVGNSPKTVARWAYGTLCPESSAKRVLERTAFLLEQQSEGHTI